MADLTIRDWMVIIGVLLILVVLLDAWRRVHNERRSVVRLKLQTPHHGEEPRSGKEDDLTWLKELPNGGARVVERDDLLRAGQAAQAAAQEASKAAKASSPRRQRSATDGKAADESRAKAKVRQEPRVEPQPEPQAEARNEARPEPEQPAPEPVVAQEPETVPEPEHTTIPEAPPVEDLVTGMNAGRDDDLEDFHWEHEAEAAELGDEPETEPAAPVEEEINRLPRSVESEVFMLNVVARDPRGFKGEDILHILLACDLRFGDMSFFHRHEHEAGKGAIQFSVANMMQPGVFDIDNMGDFTTPGLVFFVTLPGPEDMMKAFDYMLETAQAVARNLGGDVLDETRSVLTRQALEHNRQQIRDLERRMLARVR